jgi:glutaminase
MMPPRRVQITGDWFHPRVPDGAVYVGRSAPYLKQSRYRNLFTVKEFGREDAVRLYREYLLTTPGLLDAARAQLAGRDLACWCKPDEPCHADVLLELVNN